MEINFQFVVHLKVHNKIPRIIILVVVGGCVDALPDCTAIIN